MNNLYYGFRGDPGQRVPLNPAHPSHPTSASAKEQHRESQHNQPPLSSAGLQNGAQSINTPNPVNPNGSVRYTQNPNSSTASIPFANQPWAPDLPLSTSASQLLPHHTSLAVSHHQQQHQQQQHQHQSHSQEHSSPGMGYQAHIPQSLRPSALSAAHTAGIAIGGGIGIGRGPNSNATIQMPSRQTTSQSQYDDSMYHMMNKSFQDSTPSVLNNGPLSTSITHSHPDPVLTSRLHQHSAHSSQQSQSLSQSDLFARHPQHSHSHIGGSSAVFDPSEFPTLGGASGNNNGNNKAAGSSNAGGNPSSSASIINSTPISGSGAFENLPAGYKTSAIPGSMNGMNPYSELYSLGGYPSVRGKAVDALTGTGTAAEFSMQSEDFPVLGGGNGGDGNAGRSLNTANVTQGPSLDDALRNQNRTHHNASRIIGMEGTGTNSNDPFFNVASQPSQTSKLSQLSQLSGRGQYPGGSTSHLGMSSQPLSHNSIAQFDVPGAKAAAQNYLRQEQMAAMRQFGQHAKDDLPHLGHGHNVERMVPPGTSQNNNSIDNSNQGGANSYLNYGAREGGDLAAFAMSNGPNFDGNTANTSTGQEISKMNDALTGLQGLSLDSLRRERIQSSIPSSSTSATHSGIPRTAKAKGGIGEKLKGAVDRKQTRGVEETAKTKLDMGMDVAEMSDADLYGMRGLLKVLNPPAGKAEDVALLSLGLDLTQLGLDLNSTEPLYKNFRSPWDNYNKKLERGVHGVQGQGVVGNDEGRFKLPVCYYMSPPSLKGSHFGRFQLETLFYIFYSLPKDLLQALAAVELHNRQWRYHKTLKLWFTGAPGSRDAASYDRGAYIYFDISSWERRPFHDANSQFVQGLMSEDELRSIQIPPHMSNGA